MIRLARRFVLAAAAVLLAAPGASAAADVQVAVAANFTEPAREIAVAFERATGDRAILSFGSSGAFYAQISHGAPFEIFLSADADRPRQAEQEGLAIPGSRFTYAIGRLVLYSTRPGLVDGAGAVLKRGGFERLAIADPSAAPYGAAAIQTMRRLGVYQALLPKIVQGNSIAQCFSFVASGAAEIGFVALSQVIGVKGGSRWLVPQSLHAPIEQQAVMLKTGANNPATRAFAAFLRSPRAVAIIKRFGYAVR